MAVSRCIWYFTQKTALISSYTAAPVISRYIPAKIGMKEEPGLGLSLL
jgi:hypothetical protein